MCASQILTVPSQPEETMTSRPPACPSATAATLDLWPVSGWPSGPPVAASQIRTISSKPLSPPETMTSRPLTRPSATACTALGWPVSGWPSGPPPARGQRPPQSRQWASNASRSRRARAAEPGWRPPRPSGRHPVPLVHPVRRRSSLSNGSRAPLEHPTVHNGYENSSDLGRLTRSEP